MAPKPTRPSVAPSASRPISRLRGQPPAATSAEAKQAPRRSISRPAITYSATLSSLAPVAGSTAMPRASQAATSMLSSPTPSRPTAISRGAASSSTPRTWVRLRTIRPRAPASRRTRSSARSTSLGS
jgi:hypothetical protein